MFIESSGISAHIKMGTWFNYVLCSTFALLCGRWQENKLCEFKQTCLTNCTGSNITTIIHHLFANFNSNLVLICSNEHFRRSCAPRESVVMESFQGTIKPQKSSGELFRFYLVKGTKWKDESARYKKRVLLISTTPACTGCTDGEDTGECNSPINCKSFLLLIRKRCENM